MVEKKKEEKQHGREEEASEISEGRERREMEHVITSTTRDNS